MKRHEDAVHIPILNWIKRHAPQCVVWHTPNGGKRSRSEGMHMKALGALAGVSDLIVIPPPDGRIHVIEVKRKIGGTVTGEQKGFQRRVIDNGGKAIVVRSTEEVREAFAAWGIATL